MKAILIIRIPANFIIESSTDEENSRKLLDTYIDNLRIHLEKEYYVIGYLDNKTDAIEFSLLDGNLTEQHNMTPELIKTIDAKLNIAEINKL